jgi:beta-glucosidase
MQGRTYRYFRGQPLYPFGHGLSYTRFAYSGLRLSRTRVGVSDGVDVSLDVRNAGSRDGDEVVQLYARGVEAKTPAPIRSLRGFERVWLKAGESRRVRFRLVPQRDLARYDEVLKAFAVEPGQFEVELGASSADLRLRGRLTVERAR